MGESAPSDKGAKGIRAEWAERGRRPLMRKEQAGVGEPDRLGQILGKDFQMEMVFEFQWNLKFGKTLGNYTRIFRRNLDMRIIPKFF
jgi:hypothetical protein